MKSRSLMILVWFLASACTHYINVEKITPAGTIPPPPPPSDLVGSSLDRSPELPREQRIDISERHSAPAASEITNQRAEVTGSIDHFAGVYAQHKSPRIAILLNRALSDQVEEWVSDSRTVIAGGSTLTTTENGQESRRIQSEGALSISQQNRAEDGARVDAPGEHWMWAFEDGFLQPFLAARSKIIDRATIMRLIAARSGNQGSSTLAPISVKNIEMDALVNKADIFVEILISRSPSALYGYEFKASAKDVNTGQILANVTSLRWRPEEHRERRIVADSRDYQVQERILIPSVDEVASELAIDLMNALVRTWE